MAKKPDKDPGSGRNLSRRKVLSVMLLTSAATATIKDGFLTSTGGAVFSGMASLARKVVGSDGTAESNVPSQTTHRPDALELVRGMDADIWINFNRDTALLRGTSHPFYHGEITPSMFASLSLFHTAHLAQFSNVRPATGPAIHDIEGDIITVGSPSSNELMRQLMGYEAKGDDPYVLTRRKGHQALPFEFILGHDGAPVIRYADGKQYQEPHWAIRNNRSGDLFSPRLQENELASDFLLITRLENPFLPNRYVLNFGGLHGPGTAAAAKLFSDQRSYEAVTKAVQSVLPQMARNRSWQALVPIASVARRSGTHVPENIDLQGIIAEPIVI
ncbi:MAG: hypothetical protein WBA91_14795 [Paracoccaceae bacterium]